MENLESPSLNGTQFTGVVTFIFVGAKGGEIANFGGVCVWERPGGRVAVFTRSADGIRAAVSAVANDPDVLFAGAVTEEADPASLREVVDRLSAIAATGKRGQVVVSQTTRELARKGLDPEFEFHSLGAMPIGTGSIEHLLLIAHPSLPFRKDPFEVKEPVRRHSTFIGRARELESIRRLLDQSKVVSVLGSSGVGKSAVLQRLVTEIDGDFRDGAAKLDLSLLAQPALVEPMLVRMLEAPKLAAEDHLEALIAFLRPRKFLLVLDNTEHLLSEVRRIVSALIEACPELAILVGSHKALRIPSEATFRLEGLETPVFAEDWRAMRDYDAVALFVERATVVDSRFCLNDENAADIAILCRKLDGNPLAIELAASKTKALSPKQILDRLAEHRFLLLRDKDTNSLRPDRQRALEKTVDWGYQLLREEGRLLLRRLSVFIGAFTFDQAYKVCAEANSSPESVLSTFEELVDNSMVAESSTSGAEKRFHLMETIRAYAREKLRSAREDSAIQARHRQWFMAFSEAVGTNISGRQQALWLSRMDASYEDVRSVIEWNLGPRGDGAMAMKMLLNVHTYFFNRLCLREGMSLTTKVIRAQNTQSAPELARALNLASVFATKMADENAARDFAIRSVFAARSTGNWSALGRARNSLAFIALDAGRLARARRHYLGALKVLRRVDDTAACARILVNVTSLETTLELLEDARLHLYQAEALLRDDPDPSMRATFYQNSAHLAIAEGLPLRAIEHIRDALTVSAQLSDIPGIATSMRNAAFAYELLGNFEISALMMGGSQALRKRLEHHTFAYEAETYRALTWRVSAALGQVTFDSLAIEGSLLTAPEVLDKLNDTLHALIR